MEGSDRIFISRAGADREQAEWIARALEAAGYTCVTQDRDFTISKSFPADMREAFETCDTMLALMSPDYWESPFCRDEWDAAYALDRGGKGRLIPVMLRTSAVPKLVASLTYLDLAKVGEGNGQAILVAAVDGVIRGRKTLPDALEPSEDVIANAVFVTPHFTGRERELAAVHEALWSGRVTAVTGLGGTGKSALTKEYARRHGGRYAGVWLVRASEAATLHEDLAQLGIRLGVKREAGASRSGAAEAGVREASRLAKQIGRPFLILLDNVELPTRDIPDWLKQPGLHLLASSRYSTWPGWATLIEVLQLPSDTSRALLLEACHREPDSSLERLVSALGGLPLALVQAGAYLRENPSQSFSQYVDELESRLGQAPDDWRHEVRLVAATFEPSIMRAEDGAPGARALLTAASLFAPDNIPVALLTDDPDGSKTQIAVDALSRFSLWRKGEAGPHGSVYSVHRVLMRVVRSKLDADSLGAFVEDCAERLERRFAGTMSDPDTWAINAPLAPHSVALMQAAQPDAINASLVAIISQAGQYYAVQASERMDEAVQFYRRVLEINALILGSDHLEVADSMRNLAYVLTFGQRFSEAEPLWVDALSIREANLEPDDPAIVECLECLALVKFSTDRLAQAEPLYRRALSLREKTRGADDPELAVTQSSLALVLQLLDRAGEAEPLFRRAMTGYAALPGPVHPEFANACHAFGILLLNSQRFAEAVPLLDRAVAEAEFSLKPDDPRHSLWGQHYAVALHWRGAELARAGDLTEGIATLQLAQATARRYYEADDALHAQIDFYLAAAMHAQGVTIANAGDVDGGLALLADADALLAAGEGEAAERRLQVQRDINIFVASQNKVADGGPTGREATAVPGMPEMQTTRLEVAGGAMPKEPVRRNPAGKWLGFAVILAVGAGLLWVGLADPFGWFGG